MRFRKKPVEIEAHQWTGGAEAATPIINWVLSYGGTATYREEQQQLVAANGEIAQRAEPEQLRIRTLEGTMQASPGDFIIKGIQGEFYPCKPDIFEASYDPVEEPAPVRAFAPLTPTRERPFTCPNCKQTVTAQATGHINPHWQDQGFYGKPAFTCEAQEASA